MSYKYYKKSLFSHSKRNNGALCLSDERLNPNLTNPDYLVLKIRAKCIRRWIEDFKDDQQLTILDVGGRIQPYRPILGRTIKSYIAIDPQVSELVDLIAWGEALPIKDESINIVLCTQTLCYVTNPFLLVDEVYRVLIPNGIGIFSVPCFFINLGFRKKVRDI